MLPEVKWDFFVPQRVFKALLNQQVDLAPPEDPTGFYPTEATQMLQKCHQRAYKQITVSKNTGIKGRKINPRIRLVQMNKCLL